MKEKLRKKNCYFNKDFEFNGNNMKSSWNRVKSRISHLFG